MTSFTYSHFLYFPHYFPLKKIPKTEKKYFYHPSFYWLLIVLTKKFKKKNLRELQRLLAASNGGGWVFVDHGQKGTPARAVVCLLFKCFYTNYQRFSVSTFRKLRNNPPSPQQDGNSERNAQRNRHKTAGQAAQMLPHLLPTWNDTHQPPQFLTPVTLSTSTRCPLQILNNVIIYVSDNCTNI